MEGIGHFVAAREGDRPRIINLAFEAANRAAAQVIPAAASLAVTFEGGNPASPYSWTVAHCGPVALPLCPDPASRGEGVTLETKLLIVLDQMLLEWSRTAPYIPRVWTLRKAVKCALAAEAARVQAARTRSEAGRPGAACRSASPRRAPSRLVRRLWPPLSAPR
jgi:hypothetical protein